MRGLYDRNGSKEWNSYFYFLYRLLHTVCCVSELDNIKKVIKHTDRPVSFFVCCVKLCLLLFYLLVLFMYTYCTVSFKLVVLSSRWKHTSYHSMQPRSVVSTWQTLLNPKQTFGPAVKCTHLTKRDVSCSMRTQKWHCLLKKQTNSSTFHGCVEKLNIQR